MGRSLMTSAIDHEWLGNKDIDYITDLVEEWLLTNNYDVDSFSFEIMVDWEHNDESND